MKKLNNKGYMLVEIVLASALAFGVAYFLLDLTINLKNKNDDMLVKTLVTTDQAIITNMIMEDLYKKRGNDFTCSKIKVNVNENVFEYNGRKNIVNEYTQIGSASCNTASEAITIKIPLKVNIINDNFDVNIKFKK